MQSDGGSTTTPSSRSQKIAQAKWEFLFGGQSEERGCSKGTVHTAAELSFIKVLLYSFLLTFVNINIE